jgi:predicted nucleic acid-binding protein
LTDAKHEPDNRFLECAELAGAEFLVTGNKRHFPIDWKPSKIVNAREFITETGLLDPHDP